MAPMVAGQGTFEASAASASASTSTAGGGAPAFVQSKQDGMFRNSTVNDFSGMGGVVNVNPLANNAARNGQGSHGHGHNRAASSGSGGMQRPHSQQGAPVQDWALDPALMDPQLDGASHAQHAAPQEDEDYADAQDALMAYYSTNGLPPQSSQEAANQFMNGFVDYDAGGDGGQVQKVESRDMEMDIDPALQDAVRGLAQVDGVDERVEMDQVKVNGASKEVEESPFDPALFNAVPVANHGHTNGVLPSTEATAFTSVPAPASPANVKRRQSSPKTPRLDGSAVKSMSPDATRKTPSTNGKKAERLSSVTIEDADPETRKLIEQMRMENLQAKGLRRRS